MKVTKILMFVFVGFAVIFMGCKDNVPVGIWNGDRSKQFQFLYDIETREFTHLNIPQGEVIEEFFNAEHHFLLRKSLSKKEEYYNYNSVSNERSIIYPNSIIHTTTYIKEENKNVLLYWDWRDPLSRFYIYDDIMKQSEYHYLTNDTLVLNKGRFTNLFLSSDGKYVYNYYSDTTDNENHVWLNRYSIVNRKNTELFRDSLGLYVKSVSHNGDYYASIYYKENTHGKQIRYLSLLSHDNYYNKILDSLEAVSYNIYWYDDNTMYYLTRGDYEITMKKYTIGDSQSTKIRTFYSRQHFFNDDYYSFSYDNSTLLLSNKVTINIFDSFTGEEIEIIDFTEFLEQFRKEWLSEYRTFEQWFIVDHQLSIDNKKILLNARFYYEEYP